ncbi:MAG: 6-hydroxymethylpterin diphosphokinase MptE-like protein [Sulfurimonas sp.]
MSMNDIEQKAVQTFQENLLFFQTTQPKLFDKIDALNLAIEKGYYEEKYSLEYKEEGYFDVYDTQNDSWLYGANSLEHAKLSAESIDFKKEGNLFETFYKVWISDEDVKRYEHSTIPESPYSASAKIINYANKHAEFDKTTMKKIYKFIFFGTGLGFHLTRINDRLKPHVMLIVEDDLELFRLSLFVTNYKELTDDGAKLFFSVFEDEDEYNETCKHFLHEMFIYNHYLKFFQILSHDDKKVKDFQKNILGQTYLTFHYSALTNSLLRSLEHLKEHYNILDVSKKLDNDYFENKPLLILGAGPSLHHNIEWLKAHQDKFIIITVTAMLSKLEKEGIKPTLLTNVHGFNDALPHVQNVKDIHFFDESIALFSTFTTPEFLAPFKKENVFLFQGTSAFKKGFNGLSSSNIGALSYGLSLKLGAKNIYLLGLDFALDQTTGESHADSHEYKKQLDINKTQYDVEEDISYVDSVILTKGNFEEKVKTNLLFNGFKTQCNLFTKTFKSDDAKVYNLSNGAYIDDTIPLKPDNVPFDSLTDLDKSDVYHSLLTSYQKRSENFLNETDIDAIKSKLAYINKIYTILEKYAKQKYHSMDDFHYHLLGTFIDILGEDYDSDAEDMNNVISMYLQYVSGYIFDIINTKELKNEKHHIKALNKIVITELKKIVSYFKEYLQDYLEELEPPQGDSN